MRHPLGWPPGSSCPLRSVAIVSLLVSTAWLLLCTTAPAQGFLEIQNAGISQYNWRPQWVDCDSDGDLDLFLTGHDTRPAAKILLNNGSGVFTETGQNLGVNGESHWLDLDGDGDLDLVMSGKYVAQEFGDYYYEGSTNAVYLNNGQGVMSHAGALPEAWVSTADINQDGKPELLIHPTGTSHRFATLLVTNGIVALVPLETGTGPTLYGVSAWKDFDRDGDMDALYVEQYGSYPKTRMYRNEGAGSFSELPIGLAGAAPVPAWEDFDGDGFPDLFHRYYNWGNPTQTLYHNERDGRFTATSVVWSGLGESSGQGVCIADYDSDGDWDALYPAAGDGTVYYAHRLYRNDSNLNFVQEPNAFPPLLWPNAAWGDYDNDGRPDLVLGGRDPSTSAYRIMLYQNRAVLANSSPLPPSGLRAQQLGDALLFQWNAASDDHTGPLLMTYELRIGTAPGGRDVVAPVSHPVTGFRRVAETGTILTNQWSLRGLKPGTYYWTVQAIDTGCRGSAWAAEQAFVITNTAPKIQIAKEVRLGPSAQGSLPLTISDDQSLPTAISVTAQSLDAALIPPSSLSLQGTGAQRTLSFRVGSGQFGTNDIVVRATDPGGLFTEARVRVVSELFTMVSFPESTNFTSLSLLQIGWGYPFSNPAVDLDRDGDLDVLAQGAYMSNNWQIPAFLILSNGGSGNFSLNIVTNLSLAGNGYGYWLDDWDHDGSVDLLYGGNNFGSGSVQLFAGDGRGSLGSGQSLGAPAANVFADVDGDGDLDVVNFGADLAWYENVAGRLQGRPPLASFPNYLETTACRAVDLDGDGDIDFMAPGAGTNGERMVIRTLRKSGVGTYTSASHTILELASLYGTYSYDADDDGDMDVQFLYSTNYIAPIERAFAANDGQGAYVFSATNLVPSPLGGDFDNDGDVDRLVGEVVGTEPYRERFRLNLKTGPGQYAPQGFAILGSGFAADFDGDGDLDYMAIVEVQDESGYVISPRQLRFFRNNTDVVSAPPPAPGGLRATQQSDDRVTFAWNAVADDHTPPPFVSYNVRVGTTPGGVEIISPCSDRLTGRRWLAGPGNVGSLTFRDIHKLPPGTYYWSVQAIDGTFTGSAWAPEQSITINKPLISTVPDVVTPPGISSRPVSFTVTGGNSPVSSLRITVVADDQTLLPASAFVLSGTGTERTLTITPANRSGETELTITATDLSGFSSITRSHVRVAWWDVRPQEQVGIQRFEEWHWADFDGDNLLDLFGYAPIGTSQPQLFSFRNVGNGQFQSVSNNLPSSSSNPVIVSGYGGDNAPDVLTLQAPDSNTALLQVWQGSGAGFLFSAFNQVSNRASVLRHQWLDMDNDGWRDVVHFGWATPAPSNAPATGLLIARGKPSGGFEYLPQRIGVSGWAMAAADFDADGDLDLVISGSDYYWGTNCNRLFSNQGNGNFTVSEAGLPQALVYRPSIADVDRDGRPDVLLCPYWPSGTNPPVLMRNTGNGFVQIPSELPPELNLASWGDYDNDGDPDLLLVTSVELPPQGDTPYRAALFRNDAGTLTRADTGLPVLVAHQAEFADVDNDGDLDLLISGETGWNRTGRFVCLNTSPKPNTPPPAPVNLRWAHVPNGVLLEWSPTADAESRTNLTYNLRLGTTPGGSEIISAVADPVSGTRRLADIGNIGHVSRWRVVLPDGTYYWSVQAIDPALGASVFASEQALSFQRPRLSELTNIVVGPSQPSPALPFTISGGTAPFTLSLVSSVPSLLAPNGLVLGGSDRSRTLTVIPRDGQSGAMTITITVTDAGGGIGTTSFMVTVMAPLTQLVEIGAPVAAGSLVWGDADKDGDLDLWISGSRYENYGYRSSILRNDRNGVLSFSLAELTQLNRGAAAWGDYDRDGDLDALISGSSSSTTFSTVLARNDLPTGFSTVSLTRLPNVGDGALAWADADGDGDLDVLICGAGSAGVRQAGIYLNNGSGSFSNNLVGLPPVSQGSVAWADFNNDGRPDFVLTGSTNGAASGAVSGLYRNLGGGAFERVADAVPRVFRSSVAWADFDCDGDPDLLVTGLSTSGPVTQLLRNANGSFSPVSTILPGVADGAVAWGDFNRDGYPDLALSGRQGNGSLLSRVYWNRSGVLSDALVDLPGLHFSSMAWGDLDFDGRLDLAISGSTNTALNLNSGQTFSAVYRNNLAQGISSPPVPAGLNALVNGSDATLSWTLPAGAPAGLSFDVRVGRTPGGSQVMAAFADPITGVRRVAQAGQAGWSRGCKLSNLPAGTYYWTVQSVDAAYTGSPFAAEGMFSIDNTQPTISAIPNQTIPMNSSIGPISFSVQDNESDPSLLTVAAVSVNPSIFPEGSIVITGSGTFREATLTPATNASGTATIVFTVRDPDGGMTNMSTRVTVASLVDAVAGFPDGQFSVLEPGDADNDGDLDLLLAGTEYISAGSGRSYVRLFLNNGDATFTGVTPSIPAVFNGAFAAWGDYDNDGDLDLFYSGAIYRQDFGMFNLVNNLLSGIQYGQAAWGDYDGDGDLDLAVSGGMGSTTFITRIYRNDGNSAFTQLGAVLQGLWYSSIAWGDADGDGDLDLAVSGAAAQNTSASPNGRIYRNDGEGQFVEALSFLGATSGNITWVDVTGDGRLDLAVTGSHGGSGINNLLVNLGNFEFSSVPLHPGASTWTDTRFLDWDADGDSDLLAGVNSIVGVYANPGTGEFPSASVATTSIRCRTLRWGDFDNDQDFDVMLNNTGTTLLSGQTRLFLSPRLSTQPEPPVVLSQTVAGNSVLLRWPRFAAINGAPVTCNVRVGTAPGRGDVLSAHSRVDGRRLLPAPGNAGFANLLTLRDLPPGTYWWTVQAVDHAWRGQPWLTEKSFTVSAPLPRRITDFQWIDPTQVRLAFDGQPGRLVALQTSTDLVQWIDRSTFTIGLSGHLETTVSVSGDRTFFRFVLR